MLGATRKGDLDDLPEISKRISSRVSYTHCVKWAIEDEDNLRMLTQAYLACTTAMDDALGKVIDALDGSEELYDRQSDPHEFENLIEKARTRDELKAVIGELSAWIPKNEPRGPDLVDDRVKP